jgi:hypothetical protein
MTFLNSAFLFALAAVSLPLIIHFLSKRRIKTIEFSSLKFLEQMQKNRMKWIKIKELILLILRMLIIALIVMAFARPTLEGFIGSGKAASSVVIILDRSASMGAEGKTGTVFEEAKRLSGRLLENLEAQDQVTIITFPDAATPLDFGPSNPGESIKLKLSGIDQSYQGGSIGEALEKALSVLGESPDLNREIYIISDLQKSSFKNLPPNILKKERWDGIHLFSINPQPTGPENVGITDIIFPPQLLVPGENFTPDVEITNYGKGSLENNLIGVVVDGERKAQAAVSLSPGRPEIVNFSFKIDRPGYHGGYVEIDYDRYGMDNRRYFTFHVPEEIKLLAVGQTESDLRFVKMALADDEAGQISYNGISVFELLRENLDDYDIILLSDIKTLDPARESAIVRFVESGGSLFVALGRSSERNAWNSFLQKIDDISVSDITGERDEYIIWDKFDYEHPIFNVYSSDNDDRSKPSIPQIHISHYRHVVGGKILGNCADDISILSESSKNSVIVYGSGFDVISGDLPTHSFFVPFLARTVEYLGSNNSQIETDGTIGKAVKWNLSSNQTEAITLKSLSDPSVNIEIAGKGGITSYIHYGEPGIYSLNSGGNQISLVAFNVDQNESDDAVFEIDEVSELFGTAVINIQPNSDLKKEIAESRFGRELWKEFLILALILLMVESLLGMTSPPKIKEA